MSEQLLNKLLETQLSVLLGLVLLVGTAAFFLDMRSRSREKKANQIVVPEDGGTRTITRDEFIYRIFTFMQRQFAEVTTEKSILRTSLEDANETTGKLSTAIDRLTDHIQSQEDAYKEHQASNVSSLKELTDYLDKRLTEMATSREEARRHMEDAEKRLQNMEETLLKKVAEVTIELSNLTKRIETLTLGNVQIVTDISTKLDDIRNQIGDVVKGLPTPPPIDEPKKDELP